MAYASASTPGYGGTSQPQTIEPTSTGPTAPASTLYNAVAPSSGSTTPTAPSSPTVATALPSAPATSPVLSNGMVPPPTSPLMKTSNYRPPTSPTPVSAPAPTPTPTPSPAPSPTTPTREGDVRQGTGGFPYGGGTYPSGARLPDGRVVPPGYRIEEGVIYGPDGQRLTEAQFQAILGPRPGDGGGGGGGGGTPTPSPSPTQGLPTINGFPIPTRDPNSVYNAGNLPEMVLPDQAESNALQTALLHYMLQNPTSMTDQGVAMLKEQQKEDILAMQDQLMQQYGQNAVSRGTFGGGWQQGMERRLGDATVEQLTGAYRDIDIQRMQKDFQDRLAALGMSDQVLGGQMNRGIAEQNLLLQRALGQEGLNQAQSQSYLNAYGADLDAYMQAQEALARQRGLTIQQQLGQGALSVDRARLSEMARQFNLNNQLNWAQLRSSDDLGRLGIGFNYTNLDAQRQRDLQNFFGGSF